MLEAHTVAINIKIENEITRRLDALMDGYELNHDETAELKKRVEVLEEKVS
jgi:polyhydroxyalkanoate synthesis regulator phasin